VLEKLLEYDREKLWVPEQLVEHGLATLSQPTDYEWVIKQILLFYSGAFVTNSHDSPLSFLPSLHLLR